MAETSIEWADYTFNPWIGCEKVSAGCKNCYASVDTFARTSKARGLPLWGPGSTRHRTREDNWKKAQTWNRKARAKRLGAEMRGVAHDRPRVFCASLADVFEARPELDAWRADLWALIEECTELDWLLLTKRPENVRGSVPAAWLATEGWPAHVWLGTSAEDQEQARARIPRLWDVEPAVRFVSFEPLLARVSTDLFAPWDYAPIDWMIIGGESGPGARPCDVNWIRDLMRQGREAGASVFVKQLGALACETSSDPTRNGRVHLRDKKGSDMAEWPEDLRVRELPIR
jgi:protein gp37